MKPDGNEQRECRRSNSRQLIVGQQISHESPSVLLSQRVVVRREETAIEGLCKVGNPGVMEAVKNAGFYAAPVVDGHRIPSPG